MAGLFGGGGGGGGGQAAIAPPPQPVLAPPTPMPVPDPDAQRMAALKASAIADRGKTTRASTIIGSDDALGG